ncbi:MAG: PIN domain-containing protein [Trueperaceae bacterium]|nr:PIN domain-containing protein [Trueperaceae bacterium]
MTDPVLVDTSAWVAFFRGEEPACARVVELVGAGRAVRCGPVELELRQGLRRPEASAVLDLWSALPEVAVDGLDFASAGDLLRKLRAQGRAIPSMDGLIATLALRHDAALLTLDRHFDGIEGLRLDTLPG